MSSSPGAHLTRLLICLFCAGVSTYQYLVDGLGPCTDCLTTTARIAAGIENAPFSYRILTPRLLVFFGNSWGVHALFQLVVLFCFMMLLWTWSARWGGNGPAAVGLASVALVLMWPTWYFSDYTSLEWVLWLAGLTLLTGRSSPSALPIER